MRSILTWHKLDIITQIFCVLKLICIGLCNIFLYCLFVWCFKMNLCNISFSFWSHCFMSVNIVQTNQYVSHFFPLSFEITLDVTMLRKDMLQICNHWTNFSNNIFFLFVILCICYLFQIKMVSCFSNEYACQVIF